MTKRQTGRGSVRRLLFAASLALVALVPTWATPEVAAAADRLPDMSAASPSQFRIVNSNGRRLLRFTGILINKGAGPIEIVARRPDSSTPWRVQQIIDNTPAGNAGWTPTPRCVYGGDGHNHWHVKSMMAYHLWSGHGTRADRKVGYCFFDTTLWSPSLPRSPGSPHYRESGCGGRTALTSRTGISVGWADTYRWSLPHQWIDITGSAGRDVHGPRDVRPERLVPRGGRDRDGAVGPRCGSARPARRSRSSIGGPAASTTGRARRSRPTSRGRSRTASPTGCFVDLYCYGNAVTRAQMALFIDRATDLPPTDEDFFDDDDGATGEAAINRLAAAHITGGCGVRRYCPNDSVTRGQMASFLVRTLDLPRPSTPTTSGTTTDRPMRPTSTACSRPASRAVAARACTAPRNLSPAARWPHSCTARSRLHRRASPNDDPTPPANRRCQPILAAAATLVSVIPVGRSRAPGRGAGRTHHRDHRAQRRSCRGS